MIGASVLSGSAGLFTFGCALHVRTTLSARGGTHSLNDAASLFRAHPPIGALQAESAQRSAKVPSARHTVDASTSPTGLQPGAPSPSPTDAPSPSPTGAPSPSPTVEPSPSPT